MPWRKLKGDTRIQTIATISAVIVTPLLAIILVAGLLTVSTQGRNRDKHNDLVAAQEQVEIRLNACDVANSYNAVVVGTLVAIATQDNQPLDAATKGYIDILNAKNRERDRSCRESARSALIGK